MIRLLGEMGGAAANTVEYVVAFGRDPEAAMRVAAVLLEPGVVEAHGARARVMRAYAAAAGGRWSAAGTELDRLEPVDPAGALAHRAMLRTLPFAPTAAPAELAGLARGLERWAGEPDPPATPAAFLGHVAYRGYTRRYLTGLVEAHRGERDAAGRTAASLLADSSAQWSRDLAHDAAVGILAERARLRGDPAGALRETERLRAGDTPYPIAMNWPLRARTRERFLHATLLHEVGRGEEALAALGSFGVFALEVPYLAPAALAQARIHDAAGRSREARAHYARFAALWRDADPELRPLVDAAHRRIRELERASGGLSR